MRLNSKCPVASDLLSQAQTNICHTWETKLFGSVDVQDRDTPIKVDDLWDPDHPICGLILYIWTLETFLYREVNQASKYADKTKILTLGPYAYALGYCVGSAARKRKDIKVEIFRNGVELYRGTSLTEAQI